MSGKYMKYIIIVLMVTLTMLSLPTSLGEDLTLDNENLVVSGNFTYENVILTNGSVIYIEAYNGTAGTGELHLYADYISIDDTSSINGDGNGSRDGEGEGAGNYGGPEGGSGGAYGGNGGKGGNWDSVGGTAFGTADGEDISMGSGGGNSQYQSHIGGEGGAMLKIVATNVDIQGEITLDGTNGGSISNSNGCGGGGAGGGLLIYGVSINLSGSVISADAGNGGSSSYAEEDCGGGGGGGRIKFLNTSTVIITDITMTVNYGLGPQYAANGVVGTINYAYWEAPPEGVSNELFSFTASINSSQNTALQSTNTSFGNVTSGTTIIIADSFNLTNTGNVAATVNATFTSYVGTVYGFTNATQVVGGANFSMQQDSSTWDVLDNLITDTSLTDNVAGDNNPYNYNVRLLVPAGQAAANYIGVIEITFSDA